jgi:hypothetical protein
MVDESIKAFKLLEHLKPADLSLFNKINKNKK